MDPRVQSLRGRVPQSRIALVDLPGAPHLWRQSGGRIIEQLALVPLWTSEPTEQQSLGGHGQPSEVGRGT